MAKARETNVGFSPEAEKRLEKTRRVMADMFRTHREPIQDGSFVRMSAAKVYKEMSFLLACVDGKADEFLLIEEEINSPPTDKTGSQQSLESLAMLSASV
jgi:hypothetical protein